MEWLCVSVVLGLFVGCVLGGLAAIGIIFGKGKK